MQDNVQNSARYGIMASRDANPSMADTFCGGKTSRSYQFVSPLYLLFDVLDRKPSDVVTVRGRRDQGRGEKLQTTH